MTPSRVVLEALSAYEWVVSSKPRGLSGPQLGAGAGQSTEFLDHRKYVAGDDIRRIDWNAVARTDQLLIKRYQEEIRPSVVVLVDDSSSMSVYPDKAQATYDGVAWIHQSLSGLEAMVKVIGLEQGTLNDLQTVRGDWQTASVSTLAEGIPRRLQTIPQGAHVVLISDLLSPHDPSRLALMLRQRAHRCTVIQVLGHEDWQVELGRIQMQDSETGEIRTLTVDQSMVDRYHQRVQQLQTDWRTALQGWGELLVFQCPQQWETLAEALLIAGCLSVRTG